MNKNKRYKLYLDAGGDIDNTWRYMSFISTCWNMYGKDVDAERDISGAYKFSKEQKEGFTPWLEKQVKEGLTEQFTCNLCLQIEGR